jgi:hypothetical protein
VTVNGVVDEPADELADELDPQPVSSAIAQPIVITTESARLDVIDRSSANMVR